MNTGLTFPCFPYILYYIPCVSTFFCRLSIYFAFSSNHAILRSASYDCIDTLGGAMDIPFSRYTEKLPEEFSVRHKITGTTEKRNFHLHRQMEIVFALSGNLKCKFETGVIDIPRNGLILFNQMDLHYIYSENGSGICDRYVLYFSSGYISQFSTPEVNLLECFLLRPGNQPVVLTVPDRQMGAFLSVLSRMEYYNRPDGGRDPAPAYGRDLHLKFLLGEFLLLANQLYTERFGPLSTSAYREHARLVYDIYEYIGGHYSENLTTDSLSRLFLVSKTQLYNVFKEISGMTVSDYITEYRITRAKDFLINTDYSVEMIGQAVGYTNLSSFSRVFKEQAGCSPIQYRRRHTD